MVCGMREWYLRHQVPRPHRRILRANVQLSQECAGRCAQDGSEHRERSRNDSGWCMGAVHRRFKVQPLLLLNAAPQHDSAHAPAETHWLPTLVPQLRWIVRWKSSEHLRAQQHHQHHNGRIHTCNNGKLDRHVLGLLSRSNPGPWPRKRGVHQLQAQAQFSYSLDEIGAPCERQIQKGV